MRLPSLAGRRAVVTGGSTGIGQEIVRGLLGAGAAVQFTGLTREECDAALAALGPLAAQATATPLELGALEQVKAFAAGAATAPLDLVVNNAGIFGRPKSLTASGAEAHLGINYLGHFALTAGLWPALLRAPAPRVVTVTSVYHRRARLDLDDPGFERRPYDRVAAYGQSKLALVLFARELGRRAAAGHPTFRSVLAHPGYVATTLVEKGFPDSAVMTAFTRLGRRLVGQAPARAAASILLAATSPDARSGDCFGPTGFLELRGAPGQVDVSPLAKDEALARRLWAWSEAAAGLRFPAG